MKSIVDQMQKAAEAAQGNGESPFLTLKDKDQFRIQVLQELSEAGTGYNKEFGIASLIKVHQSPFNFKLSAACTQDDEGKCYGCEQYNREDEQLRRWKPKPKFYVNVLVKTPDGDKVKVLQQSMSPKHVALSLLEFNTEYGSVTDREYKIKRTGSEMNTTSYSLTPLEKTPLPEADKLELHDLTKMVRNIAYADQEKYFTEADKSEGTGW